MPNGVFFFLIDIFHPVYCSSAQLDFLPEDVFVRVSRARRLRGCLVMASPRAGPCGGRGPGDGGRAEAARGSSGACSP